MTLALVLAAALAAATGAGAAQPPSIVFILADDLGYGDLSSYGNREIRTPRIDEIGKSGIRLTTFYAAAPLCSPSRAALLTGREPIRTGVLSIINSKGALKAHGTLAGSEVTLAELFRARGYATAAIGKWHVGRPLPTEQGFDQYFGVLLSNNMSPFEILRNEEVVEKVSGSRARRDASASLTGRYTGEALSFLRSVPPDRPFFLYLAHAMPHWPYAPSKPFARRDGKTGSYADTVEELDHGVGRVVDYLRDSGRLAKTIVIFTSDNGASSPGSAGPLRGFKAEYFEGGLRVPCLVAWPSGIPAGRVEGAPASMLDWVPTLLSLTGAQRPADLVLDGHDISPLLLRGEPREDLFYFKHAIRSEGRKLVLPEAGGSAMLFDLTQDPGEATDLAGQRPDLVRQLAKRLEEHRAKVGRNASRPDTGRP